MEDRTIGRVFTAPGRQDLPALDVPHPHPGSYGRVTAEGVPVDPDSYDYRRAALDALHFPKLVDRFWQNLRRCAGYEVQYFATVEAQRRLAPHLHAAIRGRSPAGSCARSGPRPTTRSGGPPTTSRSTSSGSRWWTDRRLRRPGHRRLLPTWEEALDALDADPDAEPAHVVRFGDQDDLQGLLAGTPDADRPSATCAST